MNWYAIKIYYSRIAQAKKWLGEEGVEYYAQQLIPSLIFVRCDQAQAIKLRQEHYDSLMVYLKADRSAPAPIPDREFGIFRLVASSGAEGIEYLGEDKERYHLGELVEVTAGPYKGLQGHIVRIRKDRRLVVSITGVAAVATARIPDALLRPVREKTPGHNNGILPTEGRHTGNLPQEGRQTGILSQEARQTIPGLS